MNRLLLAFAITTSWSFAWAVDATQSATEMVEIGRWKVIEFAAQKQLIYRVSSTAINEPNMNITFDFVPTLKCDPAAAVIVFKRDAYNPDFDDGHLPLSYKPPGQKEATEITKTAMRKDDVFAFFQFKKLTANLLSHSRDKGRLAIWIPGSGDGEIKSSSNIYFPLEGFTQAVERARKKCNESK